MVMVKNFSFIVVLAMVIVISCNQKKDNQENNSIDSISNQDTSELLLVLIDSIANLSIDDEKYDLQFKIIDHFKNKIPISIYKGDQEEFQDNIVISVVKADSTYSHLGIVLKKPYFNVLKLRDFVDHFGAIEEKSELLKMTKQPFPDRIDLSANHYLLLHHGGGLPELDAKVNFVEIVKSYE